MATINRGLAPANPAAPVGQLRYTIGDIDYEPLVPDEPGYGNYANFSDTELEAFLARAEGSITRASGHAYMRFAALAAAGAISWKSDDLMVDGKQMAVEFRLLANIAFDQADMEDEAGASGFAIDFPFSTCGCSEWCTHNTPELGVVPNYVVVPIDDDSLDGGTA